MIFEGSTYWSMAVSLLSLHVVISIVCRFPNVGVVLPSRWGSRLQLDACVD